MAEVELVIGGRSHRVSCRDGEEDELRALGRRLDHHAAAALRVAGGPGERMMLFIALMLADECAEHERGAATSAPPATLEKIAGRLEALATALERGATDA